MRTLRVAFVSALAMDMIAGFGVGLVAMVLGLRLLWGQLGLQTAMAVLLVAPEIFIPLRRAGAEFHASTEGQAAVARVLHVLDTPVARPRPTERGEAAADATGARRRRRMDGPHPHRRVRASGWPGSGSTTPTGTRPPSASCSFDLAARCPPRPHRPLGRGEVHRAGRFAALRRSRRR